MVSLLSQLPKIVDRRKKRVGRGIGSGRGSKSGRGTTRHQKARSDIPLHFEGGQAKMIKKFPLLRGKSKNKSVRQKEVVITLDFLSKLKSSDVIDAPFLVKLGIIDSPKTKVKVVANGKIEKKLKVQLPVTKKAKTLIEKAGGSVQS